jgi:hypothetical protein
MIVIPDIPQFFWAWAYAISILFQGIYLVKKLEEQSSNKGIFYLYGNLLLEY